MMHDDDFICGVLVREIIRAKRGMEMKQAADAIFQVRLILTSARENLEQKQRDSDMQPMGQG